jgi:protease I
MTVPTLDNLRIAMLATEEIEEPELAESVRALREAGARTELLSINPVRSRPSSTISSRPRRSPSTRRRIRPIQRTTTRSAWRGGAVNADRLRTEPAVQSFIKQINGAGKPMAVICHAPWGPVPAGLPRGRTVTSTLQDDLRNTGATWADREVVVNGNLVTGRQPSDVPAFTREMLNLFAAARGA